MQLCTLSAVYSKNTFKVIYFTCSRRDFVAETFLRFLPTPILRVHLQHAACNPNKLRVSSKHAATTSNYASDTLRTHYGYTPNKLQTQTPPNSYGHPPNTLHAPPKHATLILQNAMGILKTSLGYQNKREKL